MGPASVAPGRGREASVPLGAAGCAAPDRTVGRCGLADRSADACGPSGPRSSTPSTPGSIPLGTPGAGARCIGCRSPAPAPRTGEPGRTLPGGTLARRGRTGRRSAAGQSGPSRWSVALDGRLSRELRALACRAVDGSRRNEGSAPYAGRRRRTGVDARIGRSGWRAPRRRGVVHGCGARPRWDRRRSRGRPDRRMRRGPRRRAGLGQGISALRAEERPRLSESPAMQAHRHGEYGARKVYGRCSGLLAVGSSMRGAGHPRLLAL